MTELENAREIINATDKEMARLFQQRMKAAAMVANFKKENNLPIEDLKREETLIAQNSAFVNENLRPYYVDFLKSIITLSKEFQKDLLHNERNEDIIKIKTQSGAYKVYIGKGTLGLTQSLIDNEKTLIITDNGVPEEYVLFVKAQLKNGIVLTLPQGENSKNIETLKQILQTLVENNFSRTDCIVALGGGMVGDVSGLAASVYMRGIDFYNIPTTVLSQVDSSVGGKTAVDFMGYKNLVGSFYPPKAVIIDIETLKTLPENQIANGLAESVKMALTNDKSLFELFEKCNPFDNLEEIIKRSIKIKASVVEADEKENGLRRVLNFGHTLGHAIEATASMKYLHGECVAMGMLPMCSEEIRGRVIKVLEKLNLPTKPNKINVEQLISASSHDKKVGVDNITLVTVSQIGEYAFRPIPFAEYEAKIRQVFNQ